MKAALKRYAMAIIFLLAMSLLMLLGTLGVTKFGDKMSEDIGVKMQPRGENLMK